MPLTGTVTAAALNTAFDASLSAMTTNAAAGAKDHVEVLRLASLASGASIYLRSMAWTQPDDGYLRAMYFQATDTGVRTIGATLTVDNGDTSFLNDQSVTMILATINGTTSTSRVPLDESAYIYLLRGVRYRLTITNTSGGTVTGPLMLTLLTRAGRRRR